MTEVKKVEFAYTAKGAVEAFASQFQLPIPFLPLNPEKTHMKLQEMIEAGWDAEKNTEKMF